MKSRRKRRQARGSARTRPTIDIVVESPLWRSQGEARGLLRRAIIEAASAVATSECELAVVLTDDSRIQSLNRDWRDRDAATNVLSFPAAATNGARGNDRLLGDIVIAYETTQREARAGRKRFAHHLAHLAVHGFLHLAGYDHEADEEADAMERLETAILARLDVPDPYVARGNA